MERATVLTLAALSVVGAGGAPFFAACSGGDNPGQVPTTSPPAKAGTYDGEAGAPCKASPGSFPNPECDDGNESYCSPPTPGCNLSSCQAASTAAGSCEPLTTNPPGGPWDFRMRRIIIAAPTNLANSTVQNEVVTSGVNLNEPQCGEEGTGDFSWLIHLDTTNAAAMTLKTGGAPPCDIANTVTSTASPFPSCNPFTTGYCFLTANAGGLPVAPVTAPVQQATDGTYQALNLGTLNIPIFFDGSVIVLPIQAGAVSGVKVSDNGNCIGSFNPAAFDGMPCGDSYQNCSKWLTAGSLSGFITLEQADQVQVNLLAKTLCVVITGTPGVAPEGGGNVVCARDASGNITAKGDYCSGAGGSTAGPGGCQDSFWLAATFAASAVKITGDCATDGG